MNVWFIVFIVIAIAARLFSLAISQGNEKRLKAEGGVEHGRAVNIGLAVMHVLFYAGCIAEGLLNHPPFDLVSIAGVSVWVLSMIALAAVMLILGRFWTVKLIVAKDHVAVQHPFMKLFRHPNYFLNMLPELAALAIASRALVTFMVAYPVYVILVALRIREEEKVMRANVKGY